ncbi:MAG: IPT/TIG domain-containing protein [Persicimonas sp.]
MPLSPRRSLGLIVGLLVLMLQAPAFASDYILKNDSMGENFEGKIATAQLIEDEIYAATFTLPASWQYPIELVGVRVLMVDGEESSQSYCGRFTVEVWEESNAPTQTHTCPPNVRTKDPDNVIYSMSDQFVNNPLGFEISGDPNNLQDLRFSAINNNPNLNATIDPVMIDTQQVRVGIKALDTDCTTPGDAFPVMVTDDDGTSTDNFLYGEADFCGGITGTVPPAEFYYWADFAQYFATTPGDFVLRLIFDRPTGGDDAGTSDKDAGMDAGMDTGMDTGTDVGSGDIGLDATVSDSGEDGAVSDTASAELAITSVSPSTTENDSSTNLSIVGRGFEPGAKVLLDVDPIGVTDVSSGLIRAIVSEGFATGTYDVIVENPDGQTALLAQALTIVEPGSGGDAGSGADAADTHDAENISENPSTGSGAAADGCACRSIGSPGGSSSVVWWGALIALGLWGRRRRDRRSQS